MSHVPHMAIPVDDAIEGAVPGGKGAIIEIDFFLYSLVTLGSPR